MQSWGSVSASEAENALNGPYAMPSPVYNGSGWHGTCTAWMHSAPAQHPRPIKDTIVSKFQS